MNILLTTILLTASIGCTSNGQSSNTTAEALKLDKLDTISLLETKDEPYDLKLQIERSENGQYRLVATIDLFNGSYTASPLSNNDFTGLFTISLEDNEAMTLDEAIEETPRSVETLDPFENVPVNWVREKTTYKRILHIDTQDDFEVSGLVSFTIEPRCTFEKIPFTISYASGELTLQQ